MRGVVAQRIVRTIRKPRNKADEAIAPKPGGTGLSGRSALSRRSPMGACHGLRGASCSSSRKASVAATRDLFRGSLGAWAHQTLSGLRCASSAIGAHAVIGERTRIGERAEVGAGTVVGEDCSIDNDCLLHPRVVVYARSAIGPRTIVHSGAVIGADGFGMAEQDGRWLKIPQLGRVVG